MGRVFDIKRYATGDGPGIRGLVFLKGCPLKCAWCANPESQRSESEIFFYRDRCIGCGRCVAVCPTGAIAMDPAKGLTTDASKCTACGRCVDACLVGARARVGEDRAVDDILRLLERDRAFYDNSGGGITLTGGEPLAQPDFARDLLHACREMGLHTAIETSGHAEWDAFEEVISHVELMYYDLKHSDSGVHRAWTGQPIDRIQRNFIRLGDSFAGRVVVRIPYVPGFNDSPAVLDRLFAIAKRVRNVSRVEVLPYHRLGLTKYAALGRTCAVGDLEPVQKADLESLRVLGRRHGVQVEIDGR